MRTSRKNFVSFFSFSTQINWPCSFNFLSSPMKENEVADRTENVLFQSFSVAFREAEKLGRPVGAGSVTVSRQTADITRSIEHKWKFGDRAWWSLTIEQTVFTCKQIVTRIVTAASRRFNSVKVWFVSKWENDTLVDPNRKMTLF